MRRLKYVELVSCKKIRILKRRESFHAPNSVISGSKFAERISSAQRCIRNPVKHLRWSFCKNSEKLYKLDKVLNTPLLHAKGKKQSKMLAPYLRNFASYDRHLWNTCKRIISPGFLLFLNFDCWGHQWGKRAKTGLA